MRRRSAAPLALPPRDIGGPARSALAGTGARPLQTRRKSGYFFLLTWNPGETRPPVSTTGRIRNVSPRLRPQVGSEIRQCVPPVAIGTLTIYPECREPGGLGAPVHPAPFGGARHQYAGRQARACSQMHIGVAH